MLQTAAHPSHESCPCESHQHLCRVPILTLLLQVQGLAWGGGGQGINRVDVSLDGGKSFTRAVLLPQEAIQR